MKKILTVFILACLSCVVYAQDNVIDEIVWVVGDDAILRSDIESQRLYLQNEGQRFDGDPYCVLPEQMAIQKLFLNQAKIDSVEVSENQVIQETDRWINFAINQMGSKEKLEEYFGKKISQLKAASTGGSPNEYYQTLSSVGGASPLPPLLAIAAVIALTLCASIVMALLLGVQ